MCQWAYDVKTDIELAAGNFWPRPNVASQVVVLRRKAKKLECENPDLFVKTVHALFSARRKTIANNIKPLLANANAETIDGLFKRAGIPKTQRAENLRIEDFLLLANEILFVKMENSEGIKK